MISNSVNVWDASDRLWNLLCEEKWVEGIKVYPDWNGFDIMVQIDEPKGETKESIREKVRNAIHDDKVFAVVGHDLIDNCTKGVYMIAIKEAMK